MGLLHHMLCITHHTRKPGRISHQLTMKLDRGIQFLFVFGRWRWRYTCLTPAQPKIHWKVAHKCTFMAHTSEHASLSH
jgi:hypothetical protein